MKKHNKRIESDWKKRRSFLALLSPAPHSKRWQALMITYKNFIILIIVSILFSTSCSSEMKITEFNEKIKCLNSKAQMNEQVSSFLLSSFYNRIELGEQIHFSKKLNTCLFCLNLQYGDSSEKKDNTYWLIFDGLTGELLFQFKNKESDFKNKLNTLTK